MTLKRSSAFCGAITLSFVLFISTRYAFFVSGQEQASDESDKFIVNSQAVEEEIALDHNEDSCPCILRAQCPRIYGSNPLDFSEIGHVEPCKDDGFVRCCGVSVSVVQQTDGSPNNANDDTDEEGTWVSQSSNIGGKEDDLHLDSQGQHESNNGEEGMVLNSEEGIANGHERNDNDNNEEQNKDESEDDQVPAESNQDTQTVMVEPTSSSGFLKRKKFLRKFNRHGHTESGDESVQPMTEGNEESLVDQTILKGTQKQHQFNIVSQGDNGSRNNNTVYSQRVTNHPIYRKRNNPNNRPFTVDTSANGPDKVDNVENTSSNVDNRPKFPIRRRRPINQMRNRAQLGHQQNDTSKTGTVDDEEVSENAKREEGVYGTSSVTSSTATQEAPPLVHVSIQTTTDAVEKTPDELGNSMKRPMSRLVKPRVNALNRGRKRPNSTTQNVTGSGESLYSNNSDGPAPIPKDNEGGKQDDNSSGATIGSEDVSSGQELLSSSKLYENSPTGMLVPVRPKIRPFSRINPNISKTNDKEESTSAISLTSDVTNIDINHDESQHDTNLNDQHADVAKSTNSQPSRTNGVAIRKVPIRRVRPVLPETNNDSQIEVQETSSQVPTSPIKGRPIMRRPINSISMLKNNKQDSAAELFADHQEASLDEIQTSAENNQNHASADEKIEKLNVRAMLQGRHRINLLKTATTPVGAEQLSNVEHTVTIQKDDKSSKTSSQTASISMSSASSATIEPNRPNILRKRVRPLNRPPLLAQGQQNLNGNDDESGVNNSGESMETVQMSHSSSDGNADKQEGESNRVKIRKGMVRFPFQKNVQQQLDEQHDNSNKENSSSSLVSIPPPEESPITTNNRNLLKQRHRMRLTSNRGNLRLPQATETAESSETDSDHSIDEPATSETPVTVTSTYSRIRINNKNGLLARQNVRKYNSQPKPSETSEDSSASSSSTAAAQTDRANILSGRTRFAVQSRLASGKQKNEETSQTETPKLADSDSELAKQGQSSQLNENSENYSSHVQKKRVGFGQRKRVRGRPQYQAHQSQEDEKTQSNIDSEHQQHQQEDRIQEEEEQQQERQQEQMVSNPEKTQEAEAEHESGNNPDLQDSEHVKIENDGVTFQFENVSVALNLNQEQEEQSSSSEQPLSPDEMKVIPAEDDREMEHTTVNKNDSSNNDDSQTNDDDADAVAAAADDDDENYDKNIYPVDKNTKQLVQQHHRHPLTSELVDEEAYDLILNQDVRKTLGTQNTHPTHSGELPLSYKDHSENSEVEHHEQHNGDDGESSNFHHPPPSPSYHLSHEYNQQQENNQYYNHYGAQQHHRQTPHFDIDSHKYSNLQMVHHGLSEQNEETGGFETLELGTPDYDVQQYNDWHNEEDELDGYEEESRIHEKILNSGHNTKNRGSSQIVGNESGRQQYLLENESSSSNNINGDKGNTYEVADVSLKKGQELGPSEGTVSYLNGDFSSSERGSTPVHSGSGASDIIRKDVNKRIRQKLRRPASGYINNSTESTYTARVKPLSAAATTTAPPYTFTPSIPSPRPTYSGQDALIESVSQSVQSLPESSDYPNRKPLEQFIQNKERRNRTRTRVKLVTFPTTTQAPVIYSSTNDNYADESNTNENKNVAAESYKADNDVAKRPSFTFPPFKKSNLTLIPIAEEPSAVESDSVSDPYEPQQKVIFSSPQRTSSLPKTSAALKPNRLSHDNVNKGSYSPEKTTAPAEDDGQLQRHNFTSPTSLLSSRTKYETKNRFKVWELPSTPPSSSSTSTPNQSSSSSLPLSDDHVGPIRKPQLRLKSPQYIRKTPTTAAPIIRNHHRLNTLAPISTDSSTAYLSEENQSPPIRQEENLSFTFPRQQHQKQQHQQTPPVEVTNEKYMKQGSPSYKEGNQGTIAIRITSQPSDMIDHDRATAEREADQPPQYAVSPAIRQQHKQEKNAIDLVVEPNYNSIPHSTATASPVTSSYSEDKKNVKENSVHAYSSSNSGAIHNQKGKQSSRFKIPEKFHQQKPNLSTPGSLTTNNVIQAAAVPSPSPIPILTGPKLNEQGKPIVHNVEIDFDNDLKTTKSPAYDDNVVNIKVEVESPPQMPPIPIVLPENHQEHYRPHHESLEDTGVQQHNHQRQPHPQHAYNPATIITPVDLPHEKIPPPNQAYTPAISQGERKPNRPEIIPDIRINVLPMPAPAHSKEKPTEIFNAVRDKPVHPIPPPSPPSQIRHPSLQNTLRNSPFGPFPSSDHWSGIPSANSPKLPEYFEQKIPPTPPTPSPSAAAGLYEPDTDLRILTTIEPNRPHRPSIVKFPDTHQNDQLFEGGKTGTIRFPSSPVKFENDAVEVVEEEDEDEDDEVNQRPVNLNHNLHPNQFHHKPGQHVPTNFGGNQIPPRVPQPHPAIFPNRQVQGILQFAPPPALLTNQQTEPNNVEFIRPNNNLEHQGGNFPKPPLPINENLHLHKNRLPPPQELGFGTAPHVAPTNPVPIHPISVEIKNGELINPHYAVPNMEGPINNNVHQRHPSQMHLQHGNHKPFHHPDVTLPQIHNNIPNKQQHFNNHKTPLLEGGPPRFPTNPHHHQQQPLNSADEPFQFQKPSGVRDSHNPHFKSHNTPLHGNLAPAVQIDGRPHEAPLMHHHNHQQNLFEQPKGPRPTGNVVFETEAERKPAGIVAPPPTLGNKFPSVSLDVHQKLNVHDPLHKPVGQIKFPDVNSQGITEQKQINVQPKPGAGQQYGPPPPSQFKQPQYVPFNMGQDRPLRNESEKQQGHEFHSRPLPPPSRPLGYPQQQPPKFDGQLPPLPPPLQPFSHPTKHHPNGNFANPQKFPPHLQRPHQPMTAGGIPPHGHGPVANQQFFQQRFRNPNARTSRAANLTAEEEMGTLSSEEVNMIEQESQSDQQALFLIQDLNREDVAETHLPVTSVVSATIVQKDVEDNINDKDVKVVLDPLEAEIVPKSSSMEKWINGQENSEKLSSESGVEKVAESSSQQQRQQRELRIEETVARNDSYQDRGDNKEQLSVFLREGKFQEQKDNIARKESILHEENLQQDRLPKEIEDSQRISQSYQVAPSSTILESLKDNAPGNEKKEDSSKFLQQQKAFVEQKGNFLLSENEEEKRFAGLKSSEYSVNGALDKRALNENKKGIMKIKSGKVKNEEQQQQRLAKNKGKNEKKEEHKPNEGDSNNPVEIQEQKEFVAPKVIQRGFHPILPYSEEDPGLKILQMQQQQQPKVEKLLPPTSEARGLNSVNRPENGASPLTQPLSSNNPSTVSRLYDTSPLPQLPEAAGPFFLNSINQVPLPPQTNTFASTTNNLSPYKNILHNHLTLA